MSASTHWAPCNADAATRDDSLAAGSQPGALDPIEERHLIRLGDVHVAKHPLMAATQLVRGHRASCHRLAADKHLAHVEMLAVRADNSPRPQSLRASSSGTRRRCGLAESQPPL